MDSIKKEISKLDTAGRYQVFVHFDWLIMQLFNSSGLKQPYYIFIDNCILQDIKHRHSNGFRFYRFVATKLFFKYLKDRSGIDVKIAIPASILYEFSGKKSFDTDQEYKSCLEKLYSCLAIFNLDIHTIGFSDIYEANMSIDAIRFDEKKITKLIKNIKKKEWNVELRKGNIIKFPMGIAYRALPSDIALRYFNEGYVRWILSSIIEAKIINNRNNDKKVRKDSRHDLIFSLSGLNKMKKGVIEGLGDIDLLSYCDINSQFQNDKSFTCFAITFDEKLFTSFLYRQTLVATHEPIVTGGDSEDDWKRKFHELSYNCDRLKQTEKKEEEFKKNTMEFYSEMKEIFI